MGRHKSSQRSIGRKLRYQPRPKAAAAALHALRRTGGSGSKGEVTRQDASRRAAAAQVLRHRQANVGSMIQKKQHATQRCDCDGQLLALLYCDASCNDIWQQLHKTSNFSGRSAWAENDPRQLQDILESYSSELVQKMDGPAAACKPIPTQAAKRCEAATGR